MTALLELASRCEAASGPDRKLDQAIYRLKHPRAMSVPHLTASIDAAMHIIPEKCLAGFRALWDGENAQVYRGSVDRYEWIGGLFWKENFLSMAQTPALALCAASLRALAAIADTHPKDGDVQQAPLVSGGGAESNRPTLGPQSPDNIKG